MFGVFRRQKRALVMVEPPGQLWVARVLEVDNGILVAIEEAVFKCLGGFVGHAGVGEARPGVERPFHETAEESGRRGAVETMIVIQNPNQHVLFWKTY